MRKRDVDDLLRLEEAAQILKLSRATLYKLIATGQIPSVKLGRSRRIPAAALKQWLKERMEGSPGTPELAPVELPQPI